MGSRIVWQLTSFHDEQIEWARTKSFYKHSSTKWWRDLGHHSSLIYFSKWTLKRKITKTKYNFPDFLVNKLKSQMTVLEATPHRVAFFTDPCPPIFSCSSPWSPPFFNSGYWVPCVMCPATSAFFTQQSASVLLSNHIACLPDHGPIPLQHHLSVLLFVIPEQWFPTFLIWDPLIQFLMVWWPQP